MRKYYEDLKKIEDFDSFDRTQLLDYIHRQKCEVSALYNISAKFWAELDYIVHLIRYTCGSKGKKENFVNIVLPLMQSKIPTVINLAQRLDDREFFYLKKDLKILENIYSHTSNLLKKTLSHFIPYPLFFNAVSSMTVLSPLCEISCDCGSLARGNYPVLLSRYVASDFSKQLVDIIDYFIWFQAVFAVASEQDRKYFREQIVRKIESFTENDADFGIKSDYTAKTFVLELHEVLSEINIKSTMKLLLDKIMTSEISVSDCLDTIAAIFLDSDKISAQTNIYRDLTVISDLAQSLVKNIKNVGNTGLMEDLALAKTLKPYFMSVSRYMMSMENEIEICRLFEIVFYLEASLPSFIMHEDIVTVLEKSIAKFEAQKLLLSQTSNINFDGESVELFKEKARQLYASK